jgi:hypothetical protein
MLAGNNEDDRLAACKRWQRGRDNPRPFLPFGCAPQKVIPAVSAPLRHPPKSLHTQSSLNTIWCQSDCAAGVGWRAQREDGMNKRSEIREEETLRWYLSPALSYWGLVEAPQRNGRRRQSSRSSSLPRRVFDSTLHPPRPARGFLPSYFTPLSTSDFTTSAGRPKRQLRT